MGCSFEQIYWLCSFLDSSAPASWFSVPWNRFKQPFNQNLCSGDPLMSAVWTLLKACLISLVIFFRLRYSSLRRTNLLHMWNKSSRLRKCLGNLHPAKHWSENQTRPFLACTTASSRSSLERHRFRALSLTESLLSVSGSGSLRYLHSKSPSALKLNDDHSWIWRPLLDKYNFSYNLCFLWKLHQAFGEATTKIHARDDFLCEKRLFMLLPSAQGPQ